MSKRASRRYLYYQWINRIIQFYDPLLFLFAYIQMIPNPNHFVITLNKHPDGYTFHSFHQPAPKIKKAKPNPPKPNPSKNTNRLIKEIGLISDIPPIIPEEPIYSQQPVIDEQVRYEQDELDEQEEIDCEIHREFQLPESPAKWYKKQEIDQKQIDTFPEFFQGKGYKTPELYQNYRNFIVQAYRNNPKRYLSLTSCRRVLRGDAYSLMKIFKFLQKEGLINYCISRDGNYAFNEPLLQKMMESTKRSHSCIKKIPQKSETEETSEMDTDNLTVTVINKCFSRSYRVYCTSCKLICGVVWYTSQEEEASKTICIECYNALEKSEAANFSKIDILKKAEINSKDGKITNKTNWGLDDNMKLLDFMGSRDEKNWQNLLPQFESRKSLQDTIIQFMQFPIANFDPYAHKPTQHQKISYPANQHVSMLKSLYESSNYSKNLEPKGKPLEQSGKQIFNINKFDTLTSFLLKKYTQKIQQLNQIETVVQQTNQVILQQPLVNKVRLYPSSSKVYQQEEEIKQDEQQ